MDFDTNIGHLRMAFWNIIIISGPILSVALVVGLVIGIVQTATSINETTLSFVPKLAVVMLTMALTASFTLASISDYFAMIFETIRTIK